MRKFIAVAAVSLASVVGVAGVVGPAGAADASVIKEASIKDADASAINASGIGILNRPATSFSSPSTNSAPVHLLDQGDVVDTICYTEGQRFNDNPYWIRVSSGGNTGFVHRDAIGTSPGLPHC